MNSWPFAGLKCLAFALVVAGFIVGCGVQPKESSKSEQPTVNVLSKDKAAILAARLANDECDRCYKKRPFKPEQHEPVLIEGNLYRWGELDVAAPYGLSAIVTFHADGSLPNVQVYLSTDKEIFRRRQK